MLALLAASVLSQSTPDVKVHVVEQKEYSDRGHLELTLFPLAAQVNGRFTRHVGGAVGVTYHLHENFAVTAMGQWNYFNQESGFNEELKVKTSSEVASASSLLVNGGVLAGVEVVPFYGKFSVFNRALVHFSIVLNGMAGAGSTRHSLKPPNAAGPATYGDTGWRFMASVGGGARVKFADWFSLRLEVRDLLYAAVINTVNGCDRADIKSMNDASLMGRNTASVSAGCRQTAFHDDTGKYTTDVSLANTLLKTPSSDVLNNVGFYAGVSIDL